MAGFECIDISTEQEKTRPDAAQLFTDREEPQEAFVRKLRAFTPYRKKAFSVLSFYGIGGIGKTWLKNRLCNILNENASSSRNPQVDSIINMLPNGIQDMAREIDAYFVTYDFEDKNIASNKKNILLSIRNQLRQYNVFDFNIFDAAILDYSKKKGIDIISDETTSQIISQNDWINGVVTGIGALPGIGFASNLLQSIDIFASKIKDENKKKSIREKYSKELNEINRSSADEILDKLHNYFIADMRENMLEKAEKPLVIFLDTYEKYIDALNSDTLTLIDDYWLRKDSDCVIKSIPGIMWVILGREKLTWKDDDSLWADGKDMPEHPFSKMSEEEKDYLSSRLLEEHLIGDLGEKDTYFYLEKVGIKDELLKKQLFELTKGTPLFLDICSRHYDSIKQDKKVDISDFGENLDELVVRYLQNMPAHYREMSYFLATLGEWTDELVHDIIPQMTCIKEFTEARYKDYIKMSFVIVENKKIYKIHDSVKKAFLAQTPIELRNEVEEVLIGYYKQKENQNRNSFDSTDNLLKYVASVTQKCSSVKELYKYWNDIHSGLSSILSSGVYKEHLAVTEALYKFAKEKSDDSEYERFIVCIYANSLSLNGMITEAHEMVLQFIGIKYVEDISFVDYLVSQIRISNILLRAGKYIDASHHMTEVFDNYLEMCDQTSRIYINLLSTRANIYLHLGEDKQALELYEQVHTLEQDCLENSIYTTATLNQIGIIYGNLSNYEKALGLFEQVYKSRKEVLGEKHPDTIKALSNIAVEYNFLGEHQKAYELNEQIYNLRKEVLGEKHPDTINSLDHLGNAYHNLANHKKALELFEQAYILSKEVLGEKHPDTINVLSNVATECSSLGEYKKAYEINKQLYEQRKDVFGDKHPDTLISLRNIESISKKLEECEKSLALNRQQKILNALANISNKES